MVYCVVPSGVFFFFSYRTICGWIHPKIIQDPIEKFQDLILRGTSVCVKFIQWVIMCNLVRDTYQPFRTFCPGRLRDPMETLWLGTETSSTSLTWGLSWLPRRSTTTDVPGCQFDLSLRCDLVKIPWSPEVPLTTSPPPGSTRGRSPGFRNFIVLYRRGYGRPH